MNKLRLGQEPRESNDDDLWIVRDNSGAEIMEITCHNLQLVSLELVVAEGHDGVRNKGKRKAVDSYYV